MVIFKVSSEIHPQAPEGGKIFTVDEINSPCASPMFRDWLKGRYARYGLLIRPLDLALILIMLLFCLARSKLANILFAKQLQKEFDASSVPALAISINPGGVATDTVLNNMGSVVLFGPLLRFLVGRLAKTPLEGAATALFAATSPQVRAQSKDFAGAYLIPYGKPTLGSKDSQDLKLAEKLWKASDEISAAVLNK